VPEVVISRLSENISPALIVCSAENGSVKAARRACVHLRSDKLRLTRQNHNVFARVHFRQPRILPASSASEQWRQVLSNPLRMTRAYSKAGQHVHDR
jgi:hypothetical protein